MYSANTENRRFWPMVGRLVRTPACRSSGAFPEPKRQWFRRKKEDSANLHVFNWIPAAFPICERPLQLASLIQPWKHLECGH